MAAIMVDQWNIQVSCSGFNDIFGFFLGGPGIVGPYTNNGVNLALVQNQKGH